MDASAWVGTHLMTDTSRVYVSHSQLEDEEFGLIEDYAVYVSAGDGSGNCEFIDTFETQAEADLLVHRIRNRIADYLRT
jgi:hypothetical protein